jgi:hypothetical protein
MKEHSIFYRHINWKATGNGEYPYQVNIEGSEYVIRVNDFPEEVFYTLIVDNVEQIHFDVWPSSWTKPSQRYFE